MHSTAENLLHLFELLPQPLGHGLALDRESFSVSGRRAEVCGSLGLHRVALSSTTPCRL